MKKTMLILGLLTLWCLNLSAARRPAWVDAIPVAPHLYQGIGIADRTGSKEEDRLRADQNARTEIIQEISSSITSQVSSYYSETISNDQISGIESMDVFTSLSSAYAEATIEGIQIVDRYYDKKAKVYYTYATLRRSTFQEQMNRQADEARNLARERYQFAQDALSNGNIMAALEQLSAALSHVMITQSVVKKQLQGDLDGNGEVGFLDAGLSRELSKITHKIRIIKGSGAGQKGERNQALSEAFTGQVVYEKEDRQLPVPNLPLSLFIDGAKADYQPIINTDAEGNFQARIHKIHSASVSNPVARISLYLPHIELWTSQADQPGARFSPVAVDFEFQMDVAQSVKIFVRVIEEINGEAVRRSKSNGILIKALLSKKYKVIDARQVASKISTEELDQLVAYEAFDSLTENLVDAADYAIIGLVSSETSSTGTLNYARAMASLNAIDLSSGRIIATGQLENIKAAGNTEQRANTSAIRKCSNSAIDELLVQLDKALN